MVYADLGWTTLKYEVCKSKLLLMGRIFRATPQEKLNSFLMAATRILQIEKGNREGLLGECYQILQLLDGHLHVDL